MTQGDTVVNACLFIGMLPILFIVFVILYIVGIYVYEWLSDLWYNIRTLWGEFKGAMFDMRWGFYDMDMPPQHQPTPKLRGQVADAEDKIKTLIRDLLKSQYCAIMLNNPAFAADKYEEKLKVLQRLEESYPQLRQWYSPTQISGFMEHAACAAFGGNHEWQIMKNTLDLTR